MLDNSLSDNSLSDDSLSDDDSEREETTVGNARVPESNIFQQMTKPVLHGISAAGWHDRIAKRVDRAGDMPEPEQRAILITFDDPRMTIGARRFALACLGNNWRVRITYAKGPTAREVHRCPVCDMEVRIKKGSDTLYKHKVNGVPCVSGKPAPGSAGYKISESVRVFATKNKGRRAGMVAVCEWVDTKADLLAITQLMPNGTMCLEIVSTIAEVMDFVAAKD